MDHRDAEALAAEIAYMQDDPSFRPKRNNNMKVKEKIVLDDYIRYYIHDKKNGHDIVICYGNEKNLKDAKTLTIHCTWKKNKNPRTKPFTYGEKKDK